MSAAKNLVESPNEHAFRIQQGIMALQAEYMAKIQQAQNKQDWPAVQKFSTEMQHAIAALIAGVAPSSEAASTATPQVAPPPSELITRYPGAEKAGTLYDKSLCKMDLDLCVYDGDRDIVLNLFSDRGFFNIADLILKQLSPFKSRKELMKDALKLTPLMAPKLYKILEECVAKLGLSTKVELFVRQDRHFNAACYPPDGGGLQICLTSGLTENLSDDELKFVLGHEIGHYLFGHHRIPVGYLLHHGGGEFSPLHAMRLHAWKRNAELSADRIGLICCEDFEVAGKTFFKLSSGITDARFEFNMADYIQQYADLKGELEKDDASLEDYFTSHPFAPLRVKALETFWSSETYNILSGADKPFKFTEAAMESEIKSFMSFMEPSYLFETSDNTQLVREFIFMAGYCVAAANGTIEDSELSYIGALVDEETFNRCLKKFEVTSPVEIRKEIAELAVKVQRNLRGTDRLSLLKDLCLVAAADGSFEESEVHCLVHFADMLGIKPEFIIDTINALAKGEN